MPVVFGCDRDVRGLSGAGPPSSPRSLQALAFISALFGDFMAAVGASERIFQLVDRKPEILTKGCVRSHRPSLAMPSACVS